MNWQWSQDSGLLHKMLRCHLSASLGRDCGTFGASRDSTVHVNREYGHSIGDRRTETSCRRDALRVLCDSSASSRQSHQVSEGGQASTSEIDVERNVHSSNGSRPARNVHLNGRSNGTTTSPSREGDISTVRLVSWPAFSSSEDAHLNERSNKWVYFSNWERDFSTVSSLHPPFHIWHTALQYTNEAYSSNISWILSTSVVITGSTSSHNYVCSLTSLHGVQITWMNAASTKFVSCCLEAICIEKHNFSNAQTKLWSPEVRQSGFECYCAKLCWYSWYSLLNIYCTLLLRYYSPNNIADVDHDEAVHYISNSAQCQQVAANGKDINDMYSCVFCHLC